MTTVTANENDAAGTADRRWLVAVHAGAGRFGAAGEGAYLELMRQALDLSRSRLLQASIDATSAVDSPTLAASVATAVLGVFERSELTNCGRGANLNELGRIECEASVVCGRSRLLGACADVRGVESPSSLALALLAQAGRSKQAPPFVGREVGRQPPLVVVGEHARELARQFGLETASESDLEQFQVTEASAAHWAKWNARFQQAETIDASDGSGKGSDKREDADEALDTVGAIVLDPFGNVAAALSSGGIAYKTPGRVGLAGCPRVGCNAVNAREVLRRGVGHSDTDGDDGEIRLEPAERQKKRRCGASSTVKGRSAPPNNSFAVACSGRGEHFIRSGLMGTLSRRLARTSNMERALRKTFEDTHDDNGGEAVEGGVLALIVNRPQHQQMKRGAGCRNDSSEPTFRASHSTSRTGGASVRIQLGVAFSTPCMAVGFLHSAQPDAPHVQILRQPQSNRDNHEQLALHVSYLAL